jgi:hypothetical protein
MTTIMDWLATQPQEVKDLIGPQVEALQTSLKAARDERDAALGKLKNVPAETTELQSQLASSQKRIAFLENAGTKGVRDARLAWALANTENTFTDDGKVDWAKLKDLSPSLFNAPLKTSAGAGTDTPPAPSDVNERIRAAAKHSNK